MVWVGGLIGRSQIGTCITNCWTDAALRAESLGGIVGMSAAKQYNTYAVGDVTVGNGGTKHTWVGVLAGEITSSGMSKDSSGSYTVYPEQGAFRTANYFASDAVLKVETYDGDARHGRDHALQHGKRACRHRRVPVCGRGVR